MYEEFYGFSERPFQLTPDPAFYFESVTHKKALSYLGYGLNQGEGFIVITGEVGSGKSTLVAHLKQKLDDERLTVGEVVTSALDGEEMIHVAARSFGLDVTGGDKAADLAAIEGIPFAEDGRQIAAQLGDALFMGLHQQHAETRVNAEAADQPSPLADPAVLLQQAEVLQAVLSLLHGC